MFCRFAGTGVTTYSLHPGVIRTELGRHFWPTVPLWKRVVYTPLMFFIKSPTEGAQTTIYCAVEESLQNESGLYYRSVIGNQCTVVALSEVRATADTEYPSISTCYTHCWEPWSKMRSLAPVHVCCSHSLCIVCCIIVFLPLGGSRTSCKHHIDILSPHNAGA